MAWSGGLKHPSVLNVPRVHLGVHLGTVAWSILTGDIRPGGRLSLAAKETREAALAAVQHGLQTQRILGGGEGDLTYFPVMQKKEKQLFLGFKPKQTLSDTGGDWG